MNIAALKKERDSYVVESNAKKIVLNGTFGKLGSKYSIFYAPTELVQVTLTGQLALLMLIDTLEKCGIPVISANTDGIVLYPERSMMWLVNEIIERWQDVTGFETEETRYIEYYARDVNNYIAVKRDGKIKTKGCFAPPEPVGGSWPSPTSQIVNDAVIDYLTKGIKPLKTINACADIKKFVSVRKVTGGGYYSHYPPLAKKESKKRIIELCALYEVEDYQQLLDMLRARREYLGKTVRWYYAVNCEGHIQNTAGNIVSLSEGCKPLMTLSDTLPHDLNYQYYIDSAHKIIDGFGSL